MFQANMSISSFIFLNLILNLSFSTFRLYLCSFFSRLIVNFSNIFFFFLKYSVSLIFSFSLIHSLSSIVSNLSRITFKESFSLYSISFNACLALSHS
ncbi:hypothetical protein HOB94_06110 [bacterium]|nr:hypothetical protein [bacterium]